MVKDQRVLKLREAAETRHRRLFTKNTGLCIRRKPKYRV